MSDEQVQVKFGADTQVVLDKMTGIESKLGEMSNKVGTVGESFAELGKMLAEVFAVDKLVEFTARMGELGEQAVRSAAMTGISVEKIQELGFAAKMTGGDAESMTMMVERLERSMAQARDGTGQAAVNFQALGISVTDANGHLKSADEILGEIADRFKTAPDGPDKTAIAMALLGRSGAQMIPLLNEGSEGLKEMSAQADQTGSVLQRLQAEGFEQSHQKLITLQATIRGTGVTLFDQLKPAVDQVTSDLTAFYRELGNDISQGGAFHEIIVQLIDAFEMMYGVIKTLTVALGTLGALAYDAAHGQFKDMKDVLKDAGAEIAKQWQAIDAVVQKANGNIAAATAATAAATRALSPLTAPGKEGATGPDNTLDLDDIKTEEALAKSNLAAQLAILQQEAAYHSITKQQEVEQEKQAVDQEYAITQAALQEKLTLYDQGSTEYEQTLNQMDVLYAQHTAKIAQLDVKMAQANAEASKQAYQSWMSVAKPIETAFDGMLTGVLNGTETLTQAMERSFANMAVSVVESIAKIVVEWLVFEAVTLGQGTWGEFVAISGGGPQGILGFAEGTDYVPNTGLYQLHQGEIVIPPAQSEAIRSGDMGIGGGGSNTFNINIQAIDTQTGAQFLRNNAGVIAATLSGAMRNQNSQIRKALVG